MGTSCTAFVGYHVVINTDKMVLTINAEIPLSSILVQIPTQESDFYFVLASQLTMLACI